MPKAVKGNAMTGGLEDDDINENFEVVIEVPEGHPKMHFIVYSVGGQVVDKTRIMIPSPKNPFFRRRYQDAAE